MGTPSLITDKTGKTENDDLHKYLDKIAELQEALKQKEILIDEMKEH